MVGVHKYSLLLFLLLLSANALSQTDKIYEILTEPYTRRPLVLHKGQLQMNAGYRYSMASKEFDRNGKRLNFEEKGKTFFSNDFRFSFTYGIIEYIQLSAVLDYISSVTTTPDLVLGNAGNIGNISVLDETSGINDLEINLSFRLPPVINHFDLSVKAGLSAPTGKARPDRPTHSINPPDPLDGSFETAYHYHSNPGYGTPTYFLGSNLQYSTSRFALLIMGCYNTGTGQTESIKWNHRLNAGEFLYSEVVYNHLVGHSGSISGSGAIQIFPWFSVYGQFGYFISSGGWTEITGTKIAIPESTIGIITAGYEIQVSTHIRFEQNVNIPVSGKEHLVDLMFHSGFSYNLIPLKRLYY